MYWKHFTSILQASTRYRRDLYDVLVSFQRTVVGMWYMKLFFFLSCSLTSKIATVYRTKQLLQVSLQLSLEMLMLFMPVHWQTIHRYQQMHYMLTLCIYLFIHNPSKLLHVSIFLRSSSRGFKWSLFSPYILKSIKGFVHKKCRCYEFRCWSSVGLHLPGLFGTMKQRDMQIIRIIKFFFENRIHLQFEVRLCLHYHSLLTS